MKLKAITAPFIMTAILLGSNSYALQNEKRISNKYECQFEFAKGKSEAPKAEMDHCLSKVPKEESIQFVQIISSADASGSYVLNKKLTDERLKKTQAYMLKDIKNIEVKLVSVGRNDLLGKKVHVLILASKPESSNIAIVPTLHSNKNQEPISNSKQSAFNDDENYNNFYALYKSLLKQNKIESHQATVTYDKKRF